MEAKLFEIRDRATCIAAIGIKLEAENDGERFLVYGKLGFPKDSPSVLLVFPDHNAVFCDPSDAPGRTLPSAIRYIQQDFDQLDSGSVVDVRVILGESLIPAESDRFWEPPEYCLQEKE